MANLGVRPTFGKLGFAVEAHLLNFSGDLYGQTLSMRLLQRLRGEERFAGVEALVAQIHLDVAAARALPSP